MPETVAPVTRSEIAQVLAAPLALTGPAEPALRTRARPFSEEALDSPEFAELVAQMWAVLDAIPIGVGLAAPQLGLPFALFLVDDRAGLRLALANPQRGLIVPLPKRVPDREGCLSWPGWQGTVARPWWMRVSGVLVGRGPARIEAEGFGARILDHELDHLEGRLYLDRALPDSLTPDLPPAAWRDDGLRAAK